MGIYEELQELGLISQVTDAEGIRERVHTRHAVFYSGFDTPPDRLHVR